MIKHGGPFPDHCMDNTKGFEKITETNISNSIRIPHDLTQQDLNIMLSKEIKAVYFEKQSYDIFTNPLFLKFLQLNKIKKAVIYGVATDFCVKAAVLGMRKYNVKCHLVEDAIKGVFEDKTKEAIMEMKKTGVKFVKTSDIINK